MDGQKIFIISNRLPVTIERKSNGEFSTNQSTGGLVSGLEQFHRKKAAAWIGHSGIFVNEVGFEGLRQQLRTFGFEAISVKKRVYSGYYNGMSNDAIWPLFHYFPAAMKLKREDWQCYVKVNEIFRDQILACAKPNDYIWIHDYQLMLLPHLLRQANRDLHIAYFHHIPFPSSEIFRLFPYRDDILHGLLGADLVGFHTYDYVRHFITSATRLIGVESQVDEVYCEDRFVRVGAFPLGVDINMIEKSSDTALEVDTYHQLRKDLGGKICFLGIDRLDYTKGIPERLEAFQEFLREHPEYVGEVTLVQICVPSREEISTYGNLRATVERLVSKINGQFAKPGYMPIQYIYRNFSKEEIISLYKLANVAVVTPVRDGLNLVCKEYVASRTDENGVLILSEFAGSAAEMGEALIVNPKNIHSVAQAMFKAVTMDQSEQKRRMRLLRKRILECNSSVWAKTFVEDWRAQSQKRLSSSRRLVGRDKRQFVERLKKSSRFFLFLDYDGSLTPIVSRPDLAVPSQRILETLRDLRMKTKGVVTIVTGRSKDFCSQYFCELPINIVAEHGTYFWNRENQEWSSQAVFEEFLAIKPEIIKLLEHYTRCVPGSFIEEKDLSVVWHYRLAEQVFARSQAMELTEALVQLLGNTSYSVSTGKKNIDIHHIMANKGRAVESILEKYSRLDAEPIVTIGDDKTDEDMHRVLQDNNNSIHIGNPSLYAKYYLHSPNELIDLLVDIIIQPTEISIENRSNPSNTSFLF